MTGISTNHSTYADNRIILSTFCHFRRDQWDFKSTWYPRYLDVLFFYIVTCQPIHGTTYQLGSYKFIEAGCYNSYFHSI